MSSTISRSPSHSTEPTICVRTFTGPEAKEIHLRCVPSSAAPGLHAETTSTYQALLRALDDAGATPADVVQETIFFRGIHDGYDSFREARRSALRDAADYQPASTPIGEPPLQSGARLELCAIAIVPHRRDAARRRFAQSARACACGGCEQATLHLRMTDGATSLWAGGISGPSGSAEVEAYGMFRNADELLLRNGMSYGDVVRTWIHLRHMERDYAALNQARRSFFQERSVKVRPASTGIGGAPAASAHNFTLSLYALRASRNVEVMRTPTLNEAWTYGSDFSRGLRVVEENRVALYLSGTASVDEEGRTVHPGDLESQVDRMLLNVSTLLSGYGASLRDVLSAITYLKEPRDAERVIRLLDRRGVVGIPNAIVHAPVCRPDLLCEMEAVAALPLPAEARPRVTNVQLAE